MDTLSENPCTFFNYWQNYPRSFSNYTFPLSTISSPTVNLRSRSPLTLNRAKSILTPSHKVTSKASNRARFGIRSPSILIFPSWRFAASRERSSSDEFEWRPKRNSRCLSALRGHTSSALLASSTREGDILGLTICIRFAALDYWTTISPDLGPVKHAIDRLSDAPIFLGNYYS